MTARGPSGDATARLSIEVGGAGPALRTCPTPLVAVVDDDDALRSSLADLMQAAGYCAAVFATAEDYLDSDDKHTARCLITDIQLPGLSGFDLRRQLDDEGLTTPIIMITGLVEKYTEDQARDAGAFCFLRKPFKATALFDCIQRCLIL